MNLDETDLLRCVYIQSRILIAKSILTNLFIVASEHKYFSSHIQIIIATNKDWGRS